MFRASTLQLNKTINDLIQILIVKNNVNVNIAKINLSELVNESCNLLTQEINETGCTITSDLEVTNIVFNKSYMESILINLLTNAIKYRSPERQLKIYITTRFKN